MSFLIELCCCLSNASRESRGQHRDIGAKQFSCQSQLDLPNSFRRLLRDRPRVTHTYYSILDTNTSISTSTSSSISCSTSGDEKKKAALKSNGLTPYLRDKARQSRRRGVSTPLSPSRALCGSFLSPALSRSSLSSSSSRPSPPIVFQPLLDYFYLSIPVGHLGFPESSIASGLSLINRQQEDATVTNTLSNCPSIAIVSEC